MSEVYPTGQQPLRVSPLVLSGGSKSPPNLKTKPYDGPAYLYRRGPPGS